MPSLTMAVRSAEVSSPVDKRSSKFMLFNSYDYIFVFLPISVAVYYCLLYFSGDKLISTLNARIRVVWLVIASLYFYSYWSVRYLPLLLFSAIINFIVGRSQERNATHARAWLVAGVVFNLALLCLFKYVNFAVAQLDLLLGLKLPQTHILLPIGISFFTFTQIAYLVDVSRGVAGRYDIWRYVLFVSFFPHLLAGPILHHREMMPQFERQLRVATYERQIGYGLLIFAIGLFKKAYLADSAAPYANAAFGAADSGAMLSCAAAWWGALAYTLQLYFDFSGYSDMAIGGARLFGIILPRNFDAPYRAVSFIDFWRRWHMTLSRFLRDYLYIPLGGNRRGEPRRYLNLLITMALGGIWHGAGYGFALWGVLHGVLLALNHGWRALRGRLPLRRSRLETLLGTVVTFVGVVAGWVLFRAATLEGAGRMLRAMAGLDGWASPDVGAPLAAALGQAQTIAPLQWLFAALNVDPLVLPTHPILGSIAGLAWLAPLLALAVAGPTSQELVAGIVHDARSSRLTKRARAAVLAAAAGSLFVFTLTQLNNVTEFIYFQF
jgi:alginate O-acetyltransferase complex protein AlgI